MADYKDILINFIADTKQFVGPVNQAAGSVNTFAGKLKTIKNAMMGAFAAYGVIRFTQSVLSSTDALAKQARRLNVSISDIDAYDLAFQKGGQSIQEASKSLDFFNVSLGKLSQSDPAQLKAFGNIGLDKEALAGKNYNDALELVAQQLGKVDEKTRAVASREIFGRGGIKIYEGLRGLKEARAEIEDINRSLGITGDSAGDIENIKDAFTALS